MSAAAAAPPPPPPEAFPWDTAMAFGLGVLRLSPRAFWAMTPRELGAAAGTASGAPPLKRPALDALMARFPDQPQQPPRGTGDPP